LRAKWKSANRRRAANKILDSAEFKNNNYILKKTHERYSENVIKWRAFLHTDVSGYIP